LIPLVVDEPARYQEANALRSLTMSFGMVAGPALAGALVALWGPGGALALDAGTFAVSAACLARLRPRAAAQRLAEHTGSFVEELRAGFREVRSRQWVWTSLIAMGAYHMVVLPSVYVLGPVLFENEHGGAPDWAIVTVAFGLGSIAGDVISLRVRPLRPMFVGACGLLVASTQALIIGSGFGVWAIAGLEAITGVGVALFFTLWETSLQEHIPEHAISRVSSFDYLVAAGLMPIGVLLAGPVSDSIGLHTALHVMTFIAVPLMLALVAVPSVRGLRRGSVAPGTA
jgi:MFS family permease